MSASRVSRAWRCSSVNIHHDNGHRQSAAAETATILSAMTASRTTLAAARRLAAVVGSGAIAVALGACGASESPHEPASSAPVEESTTSSQSPAETQVAEVNGAQLTAPSNWKVEQGQARVIVSAPKDDRGYSPGFGLLDADVTLAESTDVLASDVMKPGAKRLADVEFGGAKFFHVRERDDTNTIDTYGTVVDGSEVTVAWTFINDMATPKQIDELVNQVMPTFKFKG